MFDKFIWYGLKIREIYSRFRQNGKHFALTSQTAQLRRETSRDGYRHCASKHFQLPLAVVDNWRRRILRSLLYANNALWYCIRCSLRAGSHLRAHARATKSEFKSEAILQWLRESEPALISVIFSLPPPNRRNEIIQLNFTANVKFDSKVDSSLTGQCQISRENSRFFNFYNIIPAWCRLLSLFTFI